MFREAESKDAEAIGKVRVAAWRAAYRQFMPEVFLNSLDPANNLEELRVRLSSQSPDFTISVAEEREDVVGFSIIGKPRYQAAAKTIELWAVNVLPEYWRMRIGSGLVERAINFSTDAGFNSMELWCIKGNTPAEKAYRKLGFIESGQERSTTRLMGNTLHELHYVKVLSRSNEALEKNMDKACPVVIRSRDAQLEILVFRHPLAGIQLVKGTIEPGESSLKASERELREEAGISLHAKHQLLEWQRHPSEPVWDICSMEAGDGLPDEWSHYCEDDGGHILHYFWHPLKQAPSTEWHPVFVDALDVIHNALTKQISQMV